MLALNREKIWTVLGPKFGDDASESAITVRALCSLKSACASFRSHFAQCMQEFGYESSKTDPDLWMKTETRPDDKCIIHTFSVVWMAFFVSIKIQMKYCTS